jgi:hypothetical protein
MGMDVVGYNGTGSFHSNVWLWSSLAYYLCTIAPEITSHCEGGNWNDGDGLQVDDSHALAEIGLRVSRSCRDCLIFLDPSQKKWSMQSQIGRLRLSLGSCLEAGRCRPSMAPSALQG